MNVSEDDSGASQSEDSVNYANRGRKPHTRYDPHERMVPAPEVPGGPTTVARPRWPDRSRPGDRVANPNPICMHCYQKSHSRSQCKHQWKDYDQVIVSYEKLTNEERITVPPAAYLHCKEIAKNCARASQQ